MTKRRSHGDGGLHWDENRQRWIATVTVGYDARGKRITRRASGKTKTEAKDKLKGIIRDYDDGLAAPTGNYTVGNAMTDWLEHGLSGRDPNTVDMYRIYAETHIIPVLGKRKLRELTVEDVEKLLVGKSAILSTRSLQIIYSILSRAIKKAQVQDKIRRNIVLLCEVPEGRAGRPSKSLTLRQAEAVLKAAEQGLRGCGRTSSCLCSPELVPRKCARCAGAMSTWQASPKLTRPCLPTWCWCGRYARGATPRLEVTARGRARAASHGRPTDAVGETTAVTS